MTNQLRYSQIWKDTSTITLASGASHTFAGVPYLDWLHMFLDVPITGPEIPAVGVIDPTNVSTGDANLINDNLNDLCYNNSSVGSTNKELPAIDLGAPTAVAKLDIYWWNTTYTASDYRIQANNANSAAGWTDIVMGLDSTGIVGLQEISFAPQTFRYWRVFSEAGNNASYTVLSEIDAFGPSVATEKIHWTKYDDLAVTSNAGDLQITNNGTVNVDVELRHF